uniref:Transmembrane 9 superfamily member n=1 Tax=Syphacia muris TaxID=451379 RepID=A0A0N5AKV7_9BILA
MQYFLLLTKGCQAKQYSDGEKFVYCLFQVEVYVNKVGPYANIYETYHYYSLPLCRPKKVLHKSLSLGQLLEGDRMAESSYNIAFKKDVQGASLCGSYKLSPKEVDELKNAVEGQFYFELMADDFRLRNFVGYVEELKTFPHTHRVYVYTHYMFKFYYNDKMKQIIDAKLEVYESSAFDLDTFNSSSFQLFYSVTWLLTDREVRQSGKNEGFFDSHISRVQWMSILNSAFLVLLLILFVIMILLSIVERSKWWSFNAMLRRLKRVKNDLNRYNEAVSDVDILTLENGWKTISTDVFRKPVNTNLFSAVIGVGVQFVFMISIILIIGTSRMSTVHHHDSLNTIAVVVYALTSGIAGFFAARIYRQLEGENWIGNVLLTTGLFNVPLFILWAVNNSVSWIGGSTQALPYTTVVLLGLLWLIIGFPLTVIGAAIGKNVSCKYSAPCRTRNFPRQLPSLPFYHSTICFALVGGVVAFSSISVEISYLFSTVWGHQHYAMFYMMFITLCLLIAVVGATSVALTYFQLNAEDYNWWWRSIFVGGTTGLFVFCYGVFFYTYRSEMTGLQQTLQYFSNLLLLCYVFFLSLGSVSFFAAHRFVRFIYSSVKTD